MEKLGANGKTSCRGATTHSVNAPMTGRRSCESTRHQRRHTRARGLFQEARYVGCGGAVWNLFWKGAQLPGGVVARYELYCTVPTTSGCAAWFFNVMRLRLGGVYRHAYCVQALAKAKEEDGNLTRASKFVDTGLQKLGLLYRECTDYGLLT